MKIVVFDSCKFKFSQVLIDHWKSQGHEVKASIYFDPKLIPWCDVAFFDFVENNVTRASYPEDSMWSQVPGGQLKNKKIITRAHDIDIWTGNLTRVNWKWINDLVFVGSHLMKVGLGGIKPEDQKNLNIKLIPHGIDIDKFTFKKNLEPTKKIAWIGNVNHQKEPEMALQVIANYRDYELHMVGTGWKNWEKAWAEYFVDYNKLKVFFYDHVDSINDFLEDKDYLLSTSIKEAFGYVIGEAASKGIRPLIYNFYKCEEVWPSEFIWNKISDLKIKFDIGYNPMHYRNYIRDHYPIDKMLKSYDELIKI